MDDMDVVRKQNSSDGEDATAFTNIDEKEAARLVRESVLSAIALESQAQTNSSSFSPVEGELFPDIPARAVKASRYNLFIPVKDDRHLVYNTLTGSYALWSRDDYHTFENAIDRQLSIESPKLKAYVAAGYLVAQETDEITELEKRYMQVRNDPGNMVMTIAPIMACNFACDYCFQGADKPTKKMAEQIQDLLIDYIASVAPRLRQLSVTWYGGEPMMGMPIIGRLTEKIRAVCAENGVTYGASIVTNGYFLDRKNAIKLYNWGVRQCQVTLDGDAESHNASRYLLSGKPTYERIVSNMKEWISSVPLQVSIRVNIDTQNRGNVKGLIDDLHQHGFSGRKNFGMYFAPIEAITEACHGCNDVSLGKSEYALFEAELYRYAYEKGLTGLPKPPVMHGNCAAVIKNGVVVLPSGELHKCWDTVNDPSMSIGTLFDTEIAFGSELHKKWLVWSPFNNDTCRNCKILPNCTGACAFKFIHSEKTLGEAGALPCPSWKFNIHERLLIRAEKAGIISAEDVIAESGTTPDSVGANHSTSGLFSLEAVRKSQMDMHS